MCTCTWPASLGFTVNLAEALEDYVIILPSFLAYYPRPSLSPPFDLRIFTVSCALEREGVDSRLWSRYAGGNRMYVNQKYLLWLLAIGCAPLLLWLQCQSGNCDESTVGTILTCTYVPASL